MKPKKKSAARTGKGYAASANASPRVREDRQRPNARHLERIIFDSVRMGGKPSIRNLRVTVGIIVGLLAGGTFQNESVAFLPISRAGRH